MINNFIVDAIPEMPEFSDTQPLSDSSEPLSGPSMDDTTSQPLEYAESSIALAGHVQCTCLLYSLKVVVCDCFGLVLVDSIPEIPDDSYAQSLSDGFEPTSDSTHEASVVEGATHQLSESANSIDESPVQRTYLY